MFPPGYTEDLHLQISLKREKNIAKKLKTRELECEVHCLKVKVKQLEEELETVDWHIRFERDGENQSRSFKTMINF